MPRPIGAVFCDLFRKIRYSHIEIKLTVLRVIFNKLYSLNYLEIRFKAARSVPLQLTVPGIHRNAIWPLPSPNY